MTGLLGMASGYNSMHAADVLVLLGTDFPYGPFLPTHNKIVQIDIDPSHLGRRAKVQMGLCGDIKTTLEALLPLLQAKSDKSFLNDQLLGYSKVIKDLNAYVENKGSDNKIHPEYVMAMVDETAQANAIFTVDTGMTCVWGSPLPESFRPAKDVRLFQSRHNGQRYAPGYRSIVRLSGQTGDRSLRRRRHLYVTG